MSEEYKKYAVIENNAVVNIIICHAGTTADDLICFDDLPHEFIGIGWKLENGEWIAPERDIAAEWNHIRSIRNNLLLESDIYVLPDRWSSMTSEKQEEWSLYRQALRDIPISFDDPRGVIWPIKPV